MLSKIDNQLEGGGGGKGSSYVLCCEIGPQQHTDLGKLLLHTSFGRDLVL